MEEALSLHSRDVTYTVPLTVSSSKGPSVSASLEDPLLLIIKIFQLGEAYIM